MQSFTSNWLSGKVNQQTLSTVSITKILDGVSDWDAESSNGNAAHAVTSSRTITHSMSKSKEWVNFIAMNMAVITNELELALPDPE